MGDRLLPRGIQDLEGGIEIQAQILNEKSAKKIRIQVNYRLFFTYT